MKFFKICLLSLLAWVTFALAPRETNAITIDEFEGDALLNASVTNTPLSTVTTSSSAIGGKRSLYVKKTSGTGNVLLYTSNGTLNHDQGIQDAGVSIITWDGDDTADAGIPSNPTGLGGVNLTEDNGGVAKPADAFKLRLSADLGFNQPITIRIYVYTNASSSSQASLTISNDLPYTDQLIYFANFTQTIFPGITAPANFSNVGSIVLEISGNNPANDVGIQSFSTNGECDSFPVGGTVYDVCGICNNIGNGTSCLDCKGIPNGAAIPGTACDTGDVGVCQDGTYDNNCVCVPHKLPGTETCDGLDNDCNGQIDENKDACGVCGGNGLSCADCSGTPNGTKTVDQCGVCGGDGKSCLDCSGVINGSAKPDQCGVCNGDNTSCLDCKEFDLSDTQFLLDHTAKLQERLIKEMVAKILQKDKKSSTAKKYAATLRKVHTLQLRNWTLSWIPDSHIKICTNKVICIEISIKDTLDEYRAHSAELRDIAKSTIAVLKKLKVATKDFNTRNETLYKQSLTLANQMPETKSLCPK